MSRSRLRDLVLIGSAITTLAANCTNNVENSSRVNTQHSEAQDYTQTNPYISRIEYIQASSPNGHYLFHSALYSLNYFVAGHGTCDRQFQKGSYFYNSLEQLAKQETDSQLGAYTRELIEYYFYNDKNPVFQQLRTKNKINASLEDIKWILALKQANPREKRDLINTTAIVRLQERVALDEFGIKPRGYKDSLYTQKQIDEAMDLAISRSLFFEDLRDLDPSTRASYKGSMLRNRFSSSQPTASSTSSSRRLSHSSLEDLSSSYYPEQPNPTYYPETHRRSDGALQTDREDVQGTLPLDVIIDNFHIFRGNKARVITKLYDENGNLIERHSSQTSSGRALVKVTDDENIGRILNDRSTVEVTIEGIDHEGNSIIQKYNISGFDLRNSDKGESIGEDGNVYVEDQFYEVDGVELEETANTIRVEVDDQEANDN